MGDPLFTFYDKNQKGFNENIKQLLKKIYKKEVSFTQLWESFPLHVVEVKKRKGLLKHYQMP